MEEEPVTFPKIARHDTRKIARGTAHEQLVDELAVEEPLEIRVNDESVAVVLRTPGDDFDLAAGFLLTEGILKSPDQVEAIRYGQSADHPELRNIVNVALTGGTKVDLARLKRHCYVSSSCGICGKAAIENVRTGAKPSHSKARFKLEMFYSLGATLRHAQTIFARTGGLQAAGVFDAHGTLLGLREDVSRHNAADKVIGTFFLNDKLPLDKHILLVGGRVSFEIMQKALMASVPVVCAVGAPSSLAVRFAQETNMTLIGFLKAETYNIYSGAERIEV
ncbi:MAG: formate dehydrogenase accessory sulfurtransferase FdhD [Planctomycetes bacterium]|nr:formate dehydrogenase accessory sulfurtransferase FdhD [Planctomycetota bacterium]